MFKRARSASVQKLLLVEGLFKRSRYASRLSRFWAARLERPVRLLQCSQRRIATADNPGGHSWLTTPAVRHSCQGAGPASQAKKAVRWTARRFDGQPKRPIERTTPANNPGEQPRQAVVSGACPASNPGWQPRKSGRTDAGCDVMPFCQLFSFLQSFAG